MSREQAIRAAAAVGCIAVVLGVNTFLQRSEIHPRANVGLDEDLLYFPNERLISHFTGGMSGVISDLMWIQTINYASREFESKEKKFTWLSHMCNAVVQLDPYYEAAYTTGGMMLAALGEDEPALDLLQRGIVNRPNSFNIAFELTNIFLLNRRQRPEAMPLSIHYIGMLAERSDEPEFYLDWIDRIRMHGSIEGEARRVWERLVETAEDEFVRELALSQLTVLEAEQFLDPLNAAAEQFRVQNNRPPRTINELWRSELFEPPPITESHGGYYLSPDGVVHNTLTDGVQIARHQKIFRKGARSFKRRKDRFPENFDELLSWMKVTSTDHPVPGHQWRYNPASGEVEDVVVERYDTYNG